MKDLILFTDLEKLDLRIGKILSAERIEKSAKLLKLSVDFGAEGIKQVVSGIALSYNPEWLINEKYLFIINLIPRQIMGLDSEAMILCASGEDGNPVALSPDIIPPIGAAVPEGSAVH